MQFDAQSSGTRWFRRTPDSSVLDRPRLLARSLLALAQLDDQIAYYEQLLGVAADLRMPIPDFGGLELAAVGNLLLIASERAFTPVQLRTAYSLIVPELHCQLERLTALGATVVEPEERIVPGSRARVRFPHGSLAELVEHRPRPGECAVQPLERPPARVRLLARHAVALEHLIDRVTFLSTALETEDSARWQTGEQAELVLIGNMAVVGSPAGATAAPDGLDHDGPRCRPPADFVLLTDSIADLRRRAGAVRQDRYPAQAGAAERVLWRLPTGAVAEVWEVAPDSTGVIPDQHVSEFVR